MENPERTFWRMLYIVVVIVSCNAMGPRNKSLIWVLFCLLTNVKFWRFPFLPELVFLLLMKCELKVYLT